MLTSPITHPQILTLLDALLGPASPQALQALPPPILEAVRTFAFAGLAIEFSWPPLEGSQPYVLLISEPGSATQGRQLELYCRGNLVNDPPGLALAHQRLVEFGYWA